MSQNKIKTEYLVKDKWTYLAYECNWVKISSFQYLPIDSLAFSDLFIHEYLLSNKVSIRFDYIKEQ